MKICEIIIERNVGKSLPVGSEKKVRRIPVSKKRIEGLTEEQQLDEGLRDFISKIGKYLKKGIPAALTAGVIALTATHTATAATNNEAEQPWVKIKQASQHEALYQADTVFRNKDNIVNYWRLSDYNEPQLLADLTFWSAATQVQIDCNEQQIRLHTVFHQGNMGEGKVVYTMDTEWVPIEPGNQAMTWCKRPQGETPTYSPAQKFDQGIKDAIEAEDLMKLSVAYDSRYAFAAANSEPDTQDIMKIGQMVFNMMKQDLLVKNNPGKYDVQAWENKKRNFFNMMRQAMSPGNQ